MYLPTILKSYLDLSGVKPVRGSAYMEYYLIASDKSRTRDLSI